MVNITRQMGLASDPDEFVGGFAGERDAGGRDLGAGGSGSGSEKTVSGGKGGGEGGGFSLFEAETRRRIWWDVYYYDL